MCRRRPEIMWVSNWDPMMFFYLLESAGGAETLYKFDPAGGKTEKVLEGIANFTVSNDGRRTLYLAGGRWMLGENALKLGGLEMHVDPRLEWRQMYREALRIERDFFYDPRCAATT